MAAEITLTNVRVYGANVRAYANTSAGPLWGELERRAVLAQKLARRKVGVQTGALRASIYKRHLGNSTGQYIIIGSDRDYAMAHHNGTRPHIIQASTGGKLVFSKGGRTIVTSRVNHPGTKPNPYLTPFLPLFVKPKIVIK